MIRSSPIRVGFVMEQTLGHVTHHRNLEQWSGDVPQLEAIWLPVLYDASDMWQRAPLTRSNWTLRASLRARRLVRMALRNQRLDALFFHTQVTALFAAPLMGRIPTVVSLDATPINVDTVGEAYDHRPSGSARTEALKHRLSRRTFRSASHLVTWCSWAKRSLVDDYGIEGDGVTVVPPGIDLERWRFSRDIRSANRPARLLFVGGDFHRKGGEQLLAAYRDSLQGECELDIVTREPVVTSGLAGVRVHNGLSPNSDELMRLYKEADLFVFPTLGDCLPIAVMEAMASGLPVVASCVGAIDEEVDHGATGLLTRPGDTAALAHAVLELVRSPSSAIEMGAAGRRQAELKFSGSRNYGRLIDIVLNTAARPAASRLT